jgi:hypothetical protein
MVPVPLVKIPASPGSMYSMLYIHNSEAMRPIVAAEEVKGLKSVMSVTILAEYVTHCDKFSKGGPKISAGHYNTL